MTWRLARQVVRALPPSAQLLLKRGKTAVAGDDWASPIHRLRLSEQSFIDGTAAANRALAGRQRILCVEAQQAPPSIDISLALATALHLRGHDVRGLLCDGGLPLCEMNLGGIERPPCEVCSGWLERYGAAFGLPALRLSEFVSEADRRHAETLVAGIPDSRLDALTVDGVNVSRLAHRELQRYRRGYVFDPTSDPAFRQWLIAGAVLAGAARRLFDRERPDILVCSSGRTLPTACFTAVARQSGIRVVTWDREPTFPDGIVLSHDGEAGLIPLDDLWPHASTRPLAEAEQDALHVFLGRWRRSEGTPHAYNPSPVSEPAAIRTRLALRSGAPLVVAYGNSAWDMAAVDRDRGFESMFDWLFVLADYAARHPEIDLVVRAHPSESNVPDDLKSRTPVAAELRKRFAPLPNNIKLVEGNSPIDSYALAGMASVAMVYTSRIGLEIALSGKQPWLAGDTAYRGRGFTRDLPSAEAMTALLDAGASSERLASGEVELAERFAYLWFFRYVTRLPLLRPEPAPFRLESFRQLAPGGDRTIDRLCDALVIGAPFVDLSGS